MLRRNKGGVQRTSEKVVMTFPDAADRTTANWRISESESEARQRPCACRMRKQTRLTDARRLPHEVLRDERPAEVRPRITPRPPYVHLDTQLLEVAPAPGGRDCGGGVVEDGWCCNGRAMGNKVPSDGDRKRGVGRTYGA